MAAALGGLPLPQAVAQLATTYLAEAQAAARRLDEGADDEALHDVRVALRRLHSLLRAYQADLGDGLPARRIKALRRLARATNAARDAEVQYAWLKGQGKGLNRGQRLGQRWLLARLAPAGQACDPQWLRDGIARLRRKLRKPQAEWARHGGHGYAEVTAGQCRVLAQQVQERLQAITGPDDVAAIHMARIRVKRLRYLLTPLRDYAPACVTAVERLRELQDLLGELHDRHVLRQALPGHAAAAAAEQGGEAFADSIRQGRPAPATAWRPPQLPGLLVLAVRNEAGILHLHGELQARYLTRLAELHGQLSLAVHALQAAPAVVDRVS